MMVEIKIDIPKELEEEIKNISKASLSLAINRLIKSELERLVYLKKLISKSKLTEKDVKELTDKVNQSIAEKYIMKELKEIKKEIEYIKEHMIDIDFILSKEEEEILEKSIEEFKEGKSKEYLNM